SELGKQQELVLQARARKMVQAEAQEEAASMQPQLGGNGQKQEAECDPQQDDRCPEAEKAPRRRINQTTPGTAPGQNQPEDALPELPHRPSAPPQVLRANANPLDSGSSLQQGLGDSTGKSPFGPGTLANTSFSGFGSEGAAAGISPSMIDSILNGKSAIP